MQTILVLVVEDDPMILLDAEETLQAGGFATLSAVSGEDAIAKLEHTPEIRALVTDINLLQEKTGWDVARRAREITADLPVIYVTSLSAAEWTAQGVPKSVLIQKPFASVQLTTAISQLLNSTDAAPATL